MSPLDPLVLAALPRWGWGLLGGIGGAIAGSWIATAALRWPQRRSTAHGRSACDGCGAPLGAMELVPLVSWALLGGRCRRCGARIDSLHPAIEAAAAAIGAGALWLAPGAAGAAGAGFGWALLLLAVLDARQFWLPDRVTLPLGLGGLAAGVLGLAPAAGDRIWGALAGWAALAAIRTGYRAVRGREGMGAGDPKLMAAIGAWLGWAALPPVLLIASGCGLLLAGVRAARGERVTAATALPLGTLLAIAAGLSWAGRAAGKLP